MVGDKQVLNDIPKAPAAVAPYGKDPARMCVMRCIQYGIGLEVQYWVRRGTGRRQFDSCLQLVIVCTIGSSFPPAHFRRTQGALVVSGG